MVLYGLKMMKKTHDFMTMGFDVSMDGRTI